MFLWDSPRKKTQIYYVNLTIYKEVFEDGDFGDFIKPIFDTLDLYHNQG